MGNDLRNYGNLGTVIEVDRIDVGGPQPQLTRKRARWALWGGFRRLTPGRVLAHGQTGRESIAEARRESTRERAPLHRRPCRPPACRKPAPRPHRRRERRIGTRRTRGDPDTVPPLIARLRNEVKAARRTLRTRSASSTNRPSAPRHTHLGKRDFLDRILAALEDRPAVSGNHRDLGRPIADALAVRGMTLRRRRRGPT